VPNVAQLGVEKVLDLVIRYFSVAEEVVCRS